MSHVQINSHELYSQPGRKPTVGGVLDERMVRWLPPCPAVA